MKLDLSVNLCGKKLKNPLILASGILGTEPELLARVAKTGLGAVTTKSCSLEARQGHENPTVLAWEKGLINAVGLTNEGVKKEAAKIIKLKKLLKDSQVLIIASIFGPTIEDIGKTAEQISQAKPDFIELNLSCPNNDDEFGKPFGIDPLLAAMAVLEVKKRVKKIPIIAKLTHMTPHLNQVALEVEKAGADAISAINTVGPGMIIDLEAAKPILSNKVGGISGPAIKPVAVRCVYEIARVVKIPIIGIGGVTYGENAVEMIMAGATAVGVGSAVYLRGIEVFTHLTGEIKKFMAEHQYQSLKEFRGLAYEQDKFTKSSCS